MKVWLLRPIVFDGDSYEHGPWDPWYDKAFGFVIRAETEHRAREIAQHDGGDEISAHCHGEKGKYGTYVPTWTNPALVSCVELNGDGPEGVVIQDYRSA